MMAELSPTTSKLDKFKLVKPLLSLSVLSKPRKLQLSNRFVATEEETSLELKNIFLGGVIFRALVS